MDNAALLDAIGRNISINVETIPNKQNITLSETNTTPIHVRIKLHNKDDVHSRKIHISKPKATQHVEKQIKQCSSEQTILSFNLLVEPTAEKNLMKPRKRFFNRLLPNACMGIQISDDEDPYLPSAPRNNLSNTSQNSKSTDLKDSRGRDKQKKFKSGGCLDPTFSDERIAYKPTMKPIEKKDDINYSTQKKPALLINANNKDNNKSIQSLYQAAKVKSSGLLTYPNNAKEIAQERKLTSENTRRSSTYNQSGQYYFGQTKTKTSADNTKWSTDSQKLSRELLKGSVIVEAVLANTANYQSVLQNDRNDKSEINRHQIETENSIDNSKTKKSPKKKQKYKPGGCLEPHVNDEDHYAYMPSKKIVGKESDAISHINDIYREEVRPIKQEPVKITSTTKLSSSIDPNIIKNEALADMEEIIGEVKKKRSISPTQYEAIIAAGGVATGSAIETVIGSSDKNKKSPEDIVGHIFEPDNELDTEIVKCADNKKLGGNDFEPKKDQPQERQSLRERIARLSKNRLSAEFKNGKVKNNEVKKSSKGSLHIQLLKDDDSSEQSLRRISKETSRESSPIGRTISPDRKEIQQSHIDSPKKLLRDEIAQSSKDLRDDIPKHGTQQIATTKNTDKSRKSSPKRLSVELLDRGIDVREDIPKQSSIQTRAIQNADKSRRSSPKRLSIEILDRDVGLRDEIPKQSSLQTSTIQNVEKSRKSSPKRLSTELLDRGVDKTLIRNLPIAAIDTYDGNKSPELMKSKDYNAFENAEFSINKSQQQSPTRLSESQRSDEHLRKISPDRKSSKTKKVSSDVYKNQSRKTSPKRLSNEFGTKTENLIFKRISDLNKSPNTSKEQVKIYNENSPVQKYSPKKLSTELIDKYVVNKSDKNSPERRYSNDSSSAFKIRRSNLKSDRKPSNVQSRRSSRQFTKPDLKKPDDDLGNSSVDVSPERQSNKSKGFDNDLTNLQPMNYNANAHKDQFRKKSTDDLNKSPENRNSSMSMDKNLHRSSKSGHEVTVKMPTEDFSREDNSQSLQFNQKGMSSDILRKIADESKQSKHSTASIKSSAYKTSLAISDPVNDDNDLKETPHIYGNRSELIHKSFENQNIIDSANETLITFDRKPGIFDEMNEIPGNDNEDKIYQQRTDDQTASDYDRNKLMDLNTTGDDPSSNEDAESKQFDRASSSEFFPKNRIPSKLAINKAQNAHNLNNNVSQPGYQETITDHLNVQDRKSTHERIRDSQTFLPNEVYDDEGHVLNLKDSVSNMFHPNTFRPKLDNNPMYGYEDDEKYHTRPESRELDWPMDPKNSVRSRHSSISKSKSRSVQMTRSSPSVTSEDIMLENGPLVLDMAFQTYTNNANERVIKTLDSKIRSKDSARSSREIHFVKQRFQKYSDKAKVPITPNSNLSIRIHRDQTGLNKKYGPENKSVRTSKTASITTSNRSNSVSYLKHDDKVYIKTNNKYSDKRFMDVLGTIYEHELLPLQQIMKNLKLDIDRLTYEQIQVNKKLQRSSKPDRLIPVKTTCRCCHFK